MSRRVVGNAISFTLGVVIGVSTSLYCQSKTTTPPAPAPATQSDDSPSRQSAGPQLTSTEQVALSAISAQMNQARQQMRGLTDQLVSVERDIEKSHPGYHFDERNGHLEPIPHPAKK